MYLSNGPRSPDRGLRPFIPIASHTPGSHTPLPDFRRHAPPTNYGNLGLITHGGCRHHRNTARVVNANVPGLNHNRMQLSNASRWRRATPRRGLQPTAHAGPSLDLLVVEYFRCAKPCIHSIVPDIVGNLRVHTRSIPRTGLKLRPARRLSIGVRLLPGCADDLASAKRRCIPRRWPATQGLFA